jgi:hypothetical protein
VSTLIAVIAIETVSVFLMLVRWSYKAHAGDYNGHDEPPSFVTFFGAIIFGLLPPLSLAYVLGGWLRRRDVRKAEDAARLAAELREAERLLESR